MGLDITLHLRRLLDKAAKKDIGTPRLLFSAQLLVGLVIDPLLLGTSAHVDMGM